MSTHAPSPSLGRSHLINLSGSCTHIVEEIRDECIPTFSHRSFSNWEVIKLIDTYIFTPYVPAFYRPGWLRKYIMGPHTSELMESVISDVWAGIIVALTLLPQGLSYAQLANVPPINGLYSAVLPSAVYTFFGTSMQLGVGPVAIVSLLTGQLVTKYVPDYAKNTSKAIDFVAQVSFICGIFLMLLCFTKAGNLIRFISHPVMSGFTSAAAMLIGLSQLKNAFGFPSAAPQTGQEGYHYNYEVMHWFAAHWHDVDSKTGLHYVNPYTTRITVGIYIPLIFVFVLKMFVVSTPERKSKRWFRIFTYLTNIMPLFAIIIGASVAKNIIENAGDDKYASNVKVIKDLPSGLDILRKPSFDSDWGSLFGDVLPLTLISFMESYSVARRIATQRNELHILNANQELFAIGAANLLGSVSSAFPVSGSFSRSSLNAASGARTPLSKATTMFVICISLLALTKQFYYIPSGALSAIIWVAITSLISPSEFWEAWKHSKKDFGVMLVTFAVTLVWNTELGLAIGIALSVLALVFDMYAHHTFIDSFIPEEEKVVILEHYDYLTSLSEVEYIRVHSDVNFATSTRMKDYIMEEVLEQKAEIISAVMVDLSDVRVVDLTGLIQLKEIVDFAHSKGVLFATINASGAVDSSIRKFGIPIDPYSSVKGAIRKTRPTGQGHGYGDGDGEGPPTVTCKATALEAGHPLDGGDPPLPSYHDVSSESAEKKVQ